MVKKKGDLCVYEECGFLKSVCRDRAEVWCGECRGCSVYIIKHSVKGGG